MINGVVVKTTVLPGQGPPVYIFPSQESATSWLIHFSEIMGIEATGYFSDESKELYPAVIEVRAAISNTPHRTPPALLPCKISSLHSEGI